MVYHNISIYPQWTFYKMVSQIGNQPQVCYNNMSIVQMIKFIQSFNEIINVTVYNNTAYDEMTKNIKNDNIILQLRVC